MTAKSRRFVNVDAGLGIQDIEDNALKAELLSQIAGSLEAEGLTQNAAAKRLGISQPDVSRMLSRNFRQFSVERLMRFLVALGRDIEIRVGPVKASCSKSARITVIAG